MRRVVLALPLVAALSIIAAPVAFADEPTPVHVTLPEGATACLDQRAVVTTFEVRVERTAGDIQFSDGAVVAVIGLLPTSDIAEIGLQTAGNSEITLPADWSSQAEGTLSDSVVFDVTLLGVALGSVPSLDWTIELEETGTTPSKFQDFAATTDPFDVVDCTPTPTPAPVTPKPTVAPTDTLGSRPGPTNLAAFMVVLGTVVAAALLLVPARRRRRA